MMISSLTRTIARQGPSLAAGTIVAGKYRILDEAGRGGMGEVYRAEDTQLHRTVALKFLAPRLRGDAAGEARFLREARMASALEHPHISVIHEIGEDEGRPYIAMEYVRGNSVADILRAGPMEPDEIVRLALQIADALRYAHEQGIIHRDLKAANVMIAPDGRAKILDFGLAKRLDGGEPAEDETPNEGLTEAGVFLGTMFSAAPEVLQGKPADARSDIWSLGVMFYEMAAAKPPFDGRTAFELTSAILRDAPTALPESAPESLRRVILKCLEKDPNRRYQGAGETLADLQAIASREARDAAASPVGSRKGRWIILGGVLTLAMALAGWKLFLAPRAGDRAAVGGGSATPITKPRRPSRLPEANEYYEKAMLYLGRQFDLPRARKMLERALEIDPAFAEALAWHGFAYLLEIDGGYSNDSDFLYKAEAELRRALQTDPNTLRAHTGLAALYFYQNHKEPALEEIDKALKLDPGDLDARNWQANVLVSNGDLPAAKALLRKALERDALFSPARMNLGDLLRYEGDPQNAIREFGKILEQDPGYSSIQAKIARVHIDQGDLKSARARLESIRADDQGIYEVRITKAILSAKEGRKDEALGAMGDDGLKYAEIAPTATLWAAEFFAVVGEPEKALDWLEKTVRNGDERIAWFRSDPLLASVRDLPRFKKIVDSIAYRRERKK
jgi:Tfp pilus assembly protein PilF